MSSAARTARSRASPITPAAIGIVPNASGRPLRRGLQRARPSCCQCRTSTWCSRCQPQSARSPTRTRPRFMHSWGQNLQHHPHVHCIVPGGGISPDGKHWIACKSGFFLPVRVLSRLFRRLFLQGLQAMHAGRELQFFTDLAALKDTDRFRAHLAPLRKTEWVVYAKPPFAGPKQVLAYLVRYTHRVAIANSRLLDLDETHVSFRWKDYRESGLHKSKVMRINVGEFMRRFLLHVLPNGFHRIRHYG